MSSGEFAFRPMHELTLCHPTGVNSIFSQMECDRSVIEDMLGTSSGISENNIMSYLGLVEQKTTDLLTMKAFFNSKVTCRPSYHVCSVYKLLYLICPALKCASVAFTGSGRGLQSTRFSQNPSGTKSRTASEQYQHPTCSQQVS